MRTLPRRLLRDSISVQTYTGQSAYGPVYSTAATKLVKVSMIRQLVRDSDGAEVVSEMTIEAHPDDEAAFVPQSLVTYATRTATVLSAAPQARPGQTVLIRVTCT